MVRELLVLILVLTTFFIHAQKPDKEKRERKRKKDTSEVIFQPQRLEIPVKDMRDDFEVIDGYDDGLLIAQNTHEFTDNGEIWHFYLINKSLEIEWQLSTVIRQQSDLIGFDYSANYFFLMFDKPRNYRQFELLVMSKEGGAIVTSQIELPFKMELDYFEAVDAGVLLVGTYNTRPVALIHDILGDKPKVLPGFYNYNERIFDLVMDEDNRTFSVVLAEKMLNGKYTNRIKSFTYGGFLIEENLINPGEELNLIDGTTTSFDGGMQFMAGTYSKKSSSYSTGLYISKFSNGRQRFMKSYNYGDLKNFFAYKGKRPMARINRRVQRKKAKGKEPKFQYRLYIHGILPNGDENILVAEAYYARTASSNLSTGTGSNFYGTPYNGTPYNNFGDRQFLGYKYTHAIMVAFNSRGEILWDNSFKTNDVTSYNLIESIAFNVNDDMAVMMYLDDDEIKSKAVSQGVVVEEKTFTPIRLVKDGDKIKGRSQEVRGIRNWYGNNLYSYGLHRIRNKNQQTSKVRRVFYINKIQFEDEVVEKDTIFRVSSID